MMRGMFTAISGLKQHQTMLDVTANDIANVNTIGYKSSRVTFEDTLTQLQRGAAGPTNTNGGANAAQIGLGVKLGSIDHNMQTGAMQTTGNSQAATSRTTCETNSSVKMRSANSFAATAPPWVRMRA